MSCWSDQESQFSNHLYWLLYVSSTQSTCASCTVLHRFLRDIEVAQQGEKFLFCCYEHLHVLGLQSPYFISALFHFDVRNCSAVLPATDCSPFCRFFRQYHSAYSMLALRNSDVVSLTNEVFVLSFACAVNVFNHICSAVDRYLTYQPVRTVPHDAFLILFQKWWIARLIWHWGSSILQNVHDARVSCSCHTSRSVCSPGTCLSLRGYEPHSDLRVTRGWMLFMLLPRLLLFRPRRGRTIPHVSGRKMVGIVGLEQGHRGQCTSVICQTPPSPEAGWWNPEAHGPSAQFGAFGRVVRSSAGFGRLTILRELTNPTRRPPVPKHELSQEILRSELVEAFELGGDALVTCLRTARRGSPRSIWNDSRSFAPSSRTRPIRSCWCRLHPSWLSLMSPRRWLTAFAWDGWQHWQSPMEAWGGSLATLFDDWWCEPSRSSLPREQRWRPHLSNTAFQRRRVAQTKTPTPQSWQLMGSARLIWFPGALC